MPADLWSEMTRPPRVLFCAVTHEPAHGGISNVSSLLWQVIQKRYPETCRLLIAAPPGRKVISSRDKLILSRSVIQQQILGQCDLILFDHLGLARIQSMIPPFMRRPYGVFLHSIEAWAPLSRSAKKALVQAKVRIANSHYTAARIASAHPGTGPIDVCHLTLGQNISSPLSTGSSSSTSVETGLLNEIGPSSVLIVGRMMKSEQYKGHDELIQAWPLVRREEPDAQLVIAGHGDDVDRLKSLARQLGVERSVLFAGHVSDCILQILYQRASVFAMPSRAEGFGIVYLEAMANGLPCIASNQGAAAEIVIDGQTGLLVNPADTVGLAASVVQLLKDQERCHRFGRNGFQRLKETFSREKFENRVAQLLDKLSA